VRSQSADSEAASHPERCCPSHHWGYEILTYDTDTVSAALATSTATCSL